MPDNFRTYGFKYPWRGYWTYTSIIAESETDAIAQFDALKGAEFIGEIGASANAGSAPIAA